MKLVVRGYGDGNLVFEDRFEVEDPEELRPIVTRQVDRLDAYQLHMVEIEDLDEPDSLKRFLRFGTDPRRMVMPFDLPSHCLQCGALLMGGATKHAPGCAIQALIDATFRTD